MIAVDSPRNRPSRAIIIGLDGTPCSLISRFVSDGRMPNFAALMRSGSLGQMDSVLPTVSSVAWASLVTGCNPGKHNIYGFIDRVPKTHEMYIPTSRTMRARTWTEIFSGMGKRVFSMGVPTTYPPRAVNGILISGFLAPDLNRGTYPAEVARQLSSMGYRIDIDAWLARRDRERFLDDVFQAMERRFDVMFHYMGQEPWDLFVAHVIDTDRLHHFLWGLAEDGNEAYLPWFHRFYARVDRAIGEVADRLNNDVLLMVISDHGFCKLKYEVHLNYWLRQAGYLRFPGRTARGLRDLAPDTRCYSLLPGRFYLGLRGRERGGCVEPGAEYEALRQDIADGLMEIRNPVTGEPVIHRVFKREELYAGDAFDQAPDMVAMPAEGYDLKGGFDKEELMERGPVNGTHTFSDAMFFINHKVDLSHGVRLIDVFPTLFDAVGLDVPAGVDGRSVVATG
jgi:predicted AlkP superfamily phosphohydrolase/phosphomutase